MISKIKGFSKAFKERIIYEFAARTCDKEKIKYVEFLGGNLISANPFFVFSENGEEKIFVDPDEIILEFEQHTAMYRGDSENLCAHYILSLAPGERLTSGGWLGAVHDYMRSLGYDNTTKYVAVIHRDTEKEHVHIVASRVRLVAPDPSSPRAALGAHFQLVSDSNDRHKGMSAAREIEHKNCLSSPRTDGWSKEPQGFSDHAKDQAHIIRGISKDIFKASNRPRTMSQLVDRFAERGVQIKVSEKAGKVQGISYRLDRAQGRWISGSTVMSTKLTFTALQRLGVDYSPKRDNAKLGVGIGVAQPSFTPPPAADALFRAYVKIPAHTQSDLKKYVRARSRKYDFFSDITSTYIGFNVSLNLSKLKKKEVEAEIEKREQAERIKAAMKIIEEILQMIFQMFEVMLDLSANTSDFSEPALKLTIEEDQSARDAFVECNGQLKYLREKLYCSSKSPINFDNNQG